MSRDTRRLLSLVALCLIIGTVSLLAAVPAIITYQGRLTESGVPPTGSRQITFKLYNSGGAQVWSSGALTVTCTNGLFSVQLGAPGQPVLASSLFSDTGLTVGMTVGAGSELTPRTKLTSVAFSYRALVADTAALAKGLADNTVTSAKITNGTIQLADLAQNGATTNQIIKWNGSAWVVANDSVSGGGAGAYLPLAGGTMTGAITNTGNPSITMGKGNFGSGNTNAGAQAFVAGGNNSAEADYSAVSGGYGSWAGGKWSVIGGGSGNAAFGPYGAVASGESNHAGANAEDTAAVVLGGYGNFADSAYSTVGGGTNNGALGKYSAVTGGNGNYATGRSSCVGGGYINQATGDLSSVAGGNNNSASSFAAAVAGGQSNFASGNYAFAGGGIQNSAAGLYSTVGGGAHNYARGDYSVIAGGGWAGADSNVTTARHSAIGGGAGNRTEGWYSTIAGGWNNTCLGPYSFAAGAGNYAGDATDTAASCSGGRNNGATGNYSHVGGGLSNSVSGSYSHIGGGFSSTASGLYATVGGGAHNYARGDYSVIAGGGWSGPDSNSAPGKLSCIGGGAGNIAKGDYSIIPGGFNCRATGNFSFTAGTQAQSPYVGCFVWADNSAGAYSSFRENQFRIRAVGGAYFSVNNNEVLEIQYDGLNLITTSTGARLTIGGVWTNASDRNKKTDFTPVDGQQVLEKLSSLLITEWRYKADSADIKHIGPTAQDFYAAFGLGGDTVTISTIDPSGVALVAIKELIKQNAELKAEIADLKKLVRSHADNAPLEKK